MVPFQTLNSAFVYNVVRTKLPFEKCSQINNTSISFYLEKAYEYCILEDLMDIGISDRLPSFTSVSETLIKSTK